MIPADLRALSWPTMPWEDGRGWRESSRPSPLISAISSAGRGVEGVRLWADILSTVVAMSRVSVVVVTVFYN